MATTFPITTTNAIMNDSLLMPLHESSLNSSSIYSSFDSCSDDALSNIISFLDLKSAIRFTKCTNRDFRNRIFLDSSSTDEIKEISEIETAEAMEVQVETTSPEEGLKKEAAVAPKLENTPSSSIKNSNDTNPQIKNEIIGSNNSNNANNNNSNSNENNNSEKNAMLCFPSMWKEIYLRQHFAPPPPLSMLLVLQSQQKQKQQEEEENEKVDLNLISLSNYYVGLILYKRTLLQNLILHPRYRMDFHSCDRYRKRHGYSSHSLEKQSKSITWATSSGCGSNSIVFALPDSFFHFVPITPNTFQHKNQHQHHLQDNGSNEHGNEHGNDDVNDVDDIDDDPPPADFVCTSFVFTNSNTSPEMMYLDPYNGTIRIISNVMDHDSASMLELKRRKEIETFQRDYELLLVEGEEEEGESHKGETLEKGVDDYYDKSGTTKDYHCSKTHKGEDGIYDECNSNKLQSQHQRLQMQCCQSGENEELVKVQDYFDLNLNEYFDFHRGTNYTHGQQQRQQHQQLDNNHQRGSNNDMNFNLNINGNQMNNNNSDSDNEGEELIVDWLGIDSHSILDVKTNELLGSMVCAARSIIVESQMPLRQHHQQQGQRQNEEEEMVVTEILAWKKYYPTATSEHRNNDNNTDRTELYQHNQMICRFDSSPYFIDICPVNDCVYASFEPEDWMVDLTDDEILISTGTNSSYGIGAENDNGINGDNHIAGNSNDGIRQDDDSDGDNDDGGDDSDGDDDGDSFLLADRNPISSRDRKIVVYPLLKRNDDDNTVAAGDKNRQKYFPSAAECIVCDHPVTCFMVDPYGDKLVVGTARGTLEIWDVSQTDKGNCQGGRGNWRKGAKQIECIDMSSELRSVERTATIVTQAKAAFEDVERVSSSLYLNSMDELAEVEENDEVDDDFDGDFHESDIIMIDSDVSNNINHSCDETSMLLAGSHMVIDNGIIDEDNDSLMEEHDENDTMPINGEFVQQSSFGQGSLSLPQCKPSRGFSSIEIPRHSPIEKSGFVTVQHHHSEGTTLSLWQMYKKESRFQLTSLINLPLAPQPKPQVSYDGKRIIVFGQDHVGLIILVYKVTSSWEDSEHRSDEKINKKPFSEDSGGVINLRVPARIEYVNRIRHCGLGGLEYYDSMFLSVNERFIVVNTKTGNLFGGLQLCEGLFIIDLESHPPAPDMYIL